MAGGEVAVLEDRLAVEADALGLDPEDAADVGPAIDVGDVGEPEAPGHGGRAQLDLGFSGGLVGGEVARRRTADAIRSRRSSLSRTR